MVVVHHVLVKQPRLNHAIRETLAQLMVVGPCGQRLVLVRRPVDRVSTFAHVHVPTLNLNTVVLHVLDLQQNQEAVGRQSLTPDGEDTEVGVLAQ